MARTMFGSLDRPRQQQRGTTLLEALVAFLVLSLGMLTVVRVQTQLRLTADTARQRAEAVRLAQEDMEKARAFSVIAATAGAKSFAEIASASAIVDAASGYASNTRYTVSRNIAVAAPLMAKNATVSVSWIDRSGASQQVVLNSVIAGSNPAYSGALSIAPGAVAVKGALGRSFLVPLAAKDLGNGTSVLKPVSSGSVALMFDNASGTVTARCLGVNPGLASKDLTSADLTQCDPAPGQLLSGRVRFTSTAPPTANQANETPLAFSFALTLTGGTYPNAPQCFSEAMKTVTYNIGTGLRTEAVPIGATPASIGVPSWIDSGERHVAYHCVVYPIAGSTIWSGRVSLTPAGWTVGTGAGEWRVCRFSADLDGSGAVDSNIEHPAVYAGVDAALSNQNFLVIKGTETCPAGAPVKVDGSPGDVFANLSATQHQP